MKRKIWISLLASVLLMTSVTVFADRVKLQRSYFVRSCNSKLQMEGVKTESKLTRTQIDAVVKAVRDSFVLLARERQTLDPVWQALNDKYPAVPSTGFCIIGANAVYHLLGGKNAGLTPVQASYHDPELEEIDPSTRGRASHWWVRDRNGDIIDPTYDQYTAHGENPPYELGRGRGFNTFPGVPLNAAKELIQLAKQKLKIRGFKSNGKPRDEGRE